MTGGGSARAADGEVVRDGRAEDALRRKLAALGQLVGEGARLQQVTPWEDLLQNTHTAPVSMLLEFSPLCR